MSSDVDVVVRFDAALRGGDLAVARACCSADAVWEYPGGGPFGGRHLGWTAIENDLLAVRRLFSGGTYRAELMDVTLGNEYVVAVLRTTADHDGHRLDVTVCQLIRVVDGLIQEITSHVSDATAHQAFWRWH